MGESKYLDTSSQHTSIAFGATRYTENDFFFGLVISLSKGDLMLSSKAETMYSYCTDIKAGYALFDQSLGLYALGSALSNSTRSQQSYGFGYGAGIDYRPISSVSVALEYKTHSLRSSTVGSYEYDTLNGFVTFIF